MFYFLISETFFEVCCFLCQFRRKRETMRAKQSTEWNKRVYDRAGDTVITVVQSLEQQPTSGILWKTFSESNCNQQQILQII